MDDKDVNFRDYRQLAEFIFEMFENWFIGLPELLEKLEKFHHLDIQKSGIIILREALDYLRKTNRLEIVGFSAEYLNDPTNKPGYLSVRLHIHIIEAENLR